MMDKMIFGRYVPAKSLLHQMDPRSKLLFIFGFICVVFLANNFLTYGILGIFTLCALLLSNLPLRFIIGGLKPILWLILFTFFLHLFFTKEGRLFLDLKFFTVYEEGLRQGIFISLRFLSYLITSFIDINDSSHFDYRWPGDFIKPIKKD